MTTYKIQSGDTLTSIAKKYNTTVDAIAGANGIKNKNLIYTGDTLTIPDAGYTTGGGTLYSSNNGTASENKISSQSVAKDIEGWKTKRPENAKSNYADEIKGLVSTLTGMDFSYDPEKDLAYKLLRDENLRNARLSMEDALGRAVAMTGGYTNTAAQAAAQQAYNQEVSKTAELIPELYEAAYGRFEDERDYLSDSIKLLSDLDDSEFDKYTTLLKQYFTEGEMLFDNYNSLSKEEFDRYLDVAELMQKAAK